MQESLTDMRKREVYRLQNVSKWYPGTIALTDINLELYEGEIHGLAGKNGAGKSTLTGIMYGSIQPSEGELLICGNRVERLTPWRAKKLGIFLVPQMTEFALDISVAENLFLGTFPLLPGGVIDRKLIVRKTSEIIEKLGLNLSPNQPMRRVPLEEQQLLQAGKGFWVEDAKIIMLDEVTATLSMKARERFFDILRNVVAKDLKTVVLITHRLDEVMQLCDRVTVVRNGAKVCTVARSTIDAQFLAQMITGSKDEGQVLPRTSPLPEPATRSSTPFLSLRYLSQKELFQDISLDVARGEVVGLVGLEGSGVTPLLRCISGISRQDDGEVLIEGQKAAFKSPKDAIGNGIVYLPRNREKEGVVHGLSVEHNIIGGMFPRFTNKFGFIKRREVHGVVEELRALLNIVMPSSKSPIDTLSGGNKQKVVIGRLVNAKPKVFLLDQVTQGIDIEAKKEILRIIRNQLSTTAAILVSSESIEELMEVCDRIVVLFRGAIVDVFPRDAFNEEKIYSAMQGLGG